MKHPSSRLLLAAFAASPSALHAQSINIDFGPPKSVPPTTYAAAGIAGTWNAVEPRVGTLSPLVGLDGTPIAATLTLHPLSFGAATYTYDHPLTTGPDEALFDDIVLGNGDIARVFVLSGLENGLYGVITYGWSPRTTDPFSFTTAGLLFGHSGGYGCAMGGQWTGGPVPCLTHVVNWQYVTDGMIVMIASGTDLASGGDTNGMQVFRAGGKEGCRADWNADGVANSSDFFDFLNDFFAGDADFNGDGETNYRDIFSMRAYITVGC